MSDATSEQIAKRTENWLQWIALFLGILLVVVICLVLQALQTILIPFCIALFLVYLVEPLQKFLIYLKIPKGARVCMILLCTGLLLYLVGLLVYSSVKSLNQTLPQYEVRVIGLLDQVVHSLPIPSDEVNAFMRNFKWADHFKPGTIAQMIGTSFGKFGGFLGNLFLILLYMVYLLFERESFFKRIHNSFPTEKAEQISLVVNQINLGIAGYLEIKTFLSLLTGGLVTTILFLFGVDLAVFWGILTFLLNFIPSIGSVIATIFPVMIAFLQFDSLWIPVTIFGLLILIQGLIGNVIEPKVMGGKLGLSPLVVILSLIFWGWLWGPVGMILSVPIVAAIRITCEHIEILRPISGFLAEKS
ncbi:MAG: AI-2E family transporter [SAR324 cluster bacterium]|nr:AI-2E family transporter [SAR324 cluster bacterium]